MFAALVYTSPAPASADFLGFASTSTVVEGEFDTYHVLEVYALFDDPTVDGLMAGYTDAAGYGLVASARRDLRRWAW